MKRIISKFSLVILLVFISLQTYSQKSRLPGSIVTLGNEKIEGLITQQTDSKNMRECIFFKEGKMERYSPGEIKSYTIDGERIYESKVITVGASIDVPIFAQCLIKGHASMYLYIDKDRKRHYYIQKGDEFREINIDFSASESATEMNRYKGQLRIFFGDCNELSNEIESVKAKHGDIADLTIKYNECIDNGSSFIQVVKQNFRKGLILGYKFTNDFPVEFWEEIFKLGIDRTYTFVDPSMELEIGWFFEFYLGAKRNLSIVPSFVFSYNKVEVPFEQFPPEYYESPDGSKSVGYSYLKIPVSLRYNFNKFRVNPFLEAGLYLSVYTSGEGYLVTEKESPLFIPPDTYTNSMYTVWMYDYHTYGFSFGAGLNIPITDKIAVDIGGKYWLNWPFGGATEENSSMYQSIGVYLGFGF